MIFGEYIRTKLLTVSFLIIIICAIPASALPQTKILNDIKSGTGFFINDQGYIITANHVVSQCRKIYVRNSLMEFVPAELIAQDKEEDLAVLKADVLPRATAIFKSEAVSNRQMKVGDDLIVIGYPLEYGIKGIYQVSDATVVGLKGPMNEHNWIQFSNSAKQGNSGGPLLDEAGRVIGIVIGKIKIIKKDAFSDQEEILDQVDIATNFATVKNFLNKYGIYFRYFGSSEYFSKQDIENQAKYYIVNIRCIKM